MHFSTLIASLALMATTALAAPLETRTPKIVLIFQGATPEASYNEYPPTDGSTFYINHSEISVSHITLFGAGQCTLDGSDGSKTTVRTGETVDVGPPQVQISGFCYA